MIDRPHFTVPDRARVEPERLRLVEDDVAVASGVRLVATPGHTPGHQSVVVDQGDHVTVLAGQCCFTCAEFATSDPAVADLHDQVCPSTARDSIARLQHVGADVVHLSHATTPCRSPR